MMRTLARFLIVLALLGGTPMLHNPVQAQPSADALRPDVMDVALQAFQVAPSPASSTPNVIVQQTPPQTAPASFTDVLVRWQAQEPAGSHLQLELRVSNDNNTWTDWVYLEPDTQISDGPQWSNIFYVELARFYQVRTTAQPGTDGTQPALTDLEVHTLFVKDLPVTEVQTTLADAAANGATTNALARPAYVSRTAWGNPQGEEAPDAPPEFRTATHLIVHHTADANSLGSGHPNWASRVRAIWSYHTFSLGWGDIGYNWLIDPDGVIYAGRAGSTDTSKDAVGFHDAANYGSMGVSMLGTYSTVAPTTATQTSLVNLMAWKAQQRGIDPLGKAPYEGCAVSTYCFAHSSGAVVPTLAGHRQVMATSCPGDAFMAIMPTIRQRVVDKIRSDGARPDNGDLVIDNHEASFSSVGDLFQSACGVNNSSQWSWASSAEDSVTNDVVSEWRPKIASTGQYKVLVHIPSNCAGVGSYTTNARYEIAHAGGGAAVVINQQAQRGWVELGTWNFNAGSSGFVRLTDLTSEAFDQQRAVVFDAVQWQKVTQPAPPPAPTPTPTPTPTPPAARAQLIGATLRTPTIMVGDIAAVEFRIKNTGAQPFDTQAPAAGITSDSEYGWVYDEGECFAGSGGAPTYDRVKGRLRVTLGVADGSAATPINCATANTYGYPWRWGVNSVLQPGEMRTVLGYVQFRTPGTYTLDANVVNEDTARYGTDGTGTPAKLSLTVLPENAAPATALLDQSLNALATVYKLKPTPVSLLSRTTSPLSIAEDVYVGTFAWDGREQTWAAAGPVNQTDRFVVRQTRAFFAPTAGTYRFRLVSDDGSWLWIDGKLVASNPGTHATAAAEGAVTLNAGLHTLAVKAFEHTGPAQLGYSWMPPGAQTFATIPAAVSMTQGSALNIGLAADDLGGSGVKVLRYRVDNGAEQQSTTGVAMITTGGGTHTVSYQAEDMNGNAGSWKTVTLGSPSPMDCSMNNTLRPNGSIDVALACTNGTPTQFEILMRDTGTGHVRSIMTTQRTLTVFGTQGRTYEMRMRATDGVLWTSPSSVPNATLRVPTDASFTRITLPRISR